MLFMRATVHEWYDLSSEGLECYSGVLNSTAWFSHCDWDHRRDAVCDIDLGASFFAKSCHACAADRCCMINGTLKHRLVFVLSSHCYTCLHSKLYELTLRLGGIKSTFPASHTSHGIKMARNYDAFQALYHSFITTLYYIHGHRISQQRWLIFLMGL